MTTETRPGYYKDKYGNWQLDRRSGIDRRESMQARPADIENRKWARREDDRDRLADRQGQKA